MKITITITIIVLLAVSSTACTTINHLSKKALIGSRTGEYIGKELGRNTGNMPLTAVIGRTIGVSTEAFVVRAFSGSRKDSSNLVYDTSRISGERERNKRPARTERGRVYSVSGIGSGLTGGMTGNVLKPKVSTTLGFEIAIGRKNFFLYPSVDLLVFRYDQQISDANFLYGSQRSRGTYSTFTLLLGYRKPLGNFSIYPFAGFGGSMINEPRLTVNETSQQAMLGSRKSSSMALKGGIGLDYRIGQFVMFTEGSHIHNFKSLQERQVRIFPVYLGIRSNISSVFGAGREK